MGNFLIYSAAFTVLALSAILLLPLLVLLVFLYALGILFLVF